MRKKLSLMLYMLLVEAVACYLVVVPVYAFQLSSSTTGLVRVATASTMAAYQSANISTQAATIGAALVGSPAGATMALRIVAGSSLVGLGALVGLALWEVYFNAQKTDAIKAAAAPPGQVTIPGYTTPAGGTVGTCSGVSALCPFGNSTAYLVVNQGTGFCDPVAAGPVPSGWAGWYSGGGGCHAIQGSGQPAPVVVNPAGPATGTQISEYLQNLPASHPNSIANNTVPKGTDATPTPATVVATIPASSGQVATSVVPATSVQSTDVVVNPNATPAAGPQPTPASTQTTTGRTSTTSTTVTNPNGSTTTSTTTQTDDAPVSSCTVGNHEQRSFGGILQVHMETWKGSGLLSALNLLSTLVWPTTSPTYTLTSSFLGTFTFDFSAWAGMLLASRSIIIAIAGFVAYKIIFVGARA